MPTVTGMWVKKQALALLHRSDLVHGVVLCPPVNVLVVLARQQAGGTKGQEFTVGQFPFGRTNDLRERVLHSHRALVGYHVLCGKERQRKASTKHTSVKFQYTRQYNSNKTALQSQYVQDM